MNRHTVYQIRTQALGHVLGVYATEEDAAQHLPAWEAHQARLCGATHAKTKEPHWCRIVPVSLYSSTPLPLPEATHDAELPAPVVETEDTLQPLTASGVGHVSG